jgi:O-antigen ligase
MREKLALFSSLILVTGLVLSKFMISIGIILLLSTALFSNNYKRDFRKLISNPAMLAPVGIFLTVFLSGIYSENSIQFWGLIQVMLPLILLPLAFGLLPFIERKFVNSILYYMVFLMSLALIWVLWIYLTNFEFYQQQLSVSKTLPTPQEDHIRFSLLLALSVFAAFKLFFEGFYFIFPKFEKYLQLFLGMFLMVMLHVLSVRSGLLAFYIGIAIIVIHSIIVRKKLILGLGLLLSLAIMPVLAFYFVPGIRQKFYLMRYNWEQYQSGKISNLSDTQRLISYKLALKVAAQSPWIGVGAGDLYNEQEKAYKELYPELGPMQPHNQFISFYAACGILGLLSLLFFLFFPLCYKSAYRSIWNLLFFTIIFSSMLTENTLFVSVGVNFYVFFLLLNVNSIKNLKSRRGLKFANASDTENILS